MKLETPKLFNLTTDAMDVSNPLITEELQTPAYTFPDFYNAYVKEVDRTYAMNFLEISTVNPLDAPGRNTSEQLLKDILKTLQKGKKDIAESNVNEFVQTTGETIPLTTFSEAGQKAIPEPFMKVPRLQPIKETMQPPSRPAPVVPEGIEEYIIPMMQAPIPDPIDVASQRAPKKMTKMPDDILDLMWTPETPAPIFDRTEMGPRPTFTTANPPARAFRKAMQAEKVNQMAAEKDAVVNARIMKQRKEKEKLSAMLNDPTMMASVINKEREPLSSEEMFNMTFQSEAPPTSPTAPRRGRPPKRK